MKRFVLENRNLILTCSIHNLDEVKNNLNLKIHQNFMAIIMEKGFCHEDGNCN